MDASLKGKLTILMGLSQRNTEVLRDQPTYRTVKTTHRADTNGFVRLCPQDHSRRCWLLSYLIADQDNTTTLRECNRC